MGAVLFSKENVALSNMENYCYEVARQIRTQVPKESDYISIDRSHLMVSPLWHYILSGRASTEFCHRLLHVKPFVVARRIRAGGSYDEIMERIKKLVNF